MTTGERMRARRKELDISPEEVAKAIGVSRSTVFRYENGDIEKVPLSLLKPLSSILKTTPEYLMGWSDTPHAKKAQSILTSLPIYDVPVSAGTGEWLSKGHEYSLTHFDDVPKDADFALIVRGDSMEPMYFDGNIVFVKSNVIVESGQIGVFVLNGEGYLKMLQGNRLISLNRKYDPIIINEWDSFFCVGRVSGVHVD